MAMCGGLVGLTSGIVVKPRRLLAGAYRYRGTNIFAVQKGTAWSRVLKHLMDIAAKVPNSEKTSTRDFGWLIFRRGPHQTEVDGTLERL